MKVLVVEDEENTRVALLQLLTALGHEAEGVGDARSARVACENFSPDLLISDWLLKGDTDGVELVRWYSTSRPGQPVILMTGQSRGELAEVAGDLDAVVECLFKPYGVAELTAAIDRVTERNP